MIASDIIDSYIKSLAFLRQNKEYRRLRNRFRKIADRKRRHTNNPFKPLFIALFLTKHFLKSQSQNLREQISQCRLGFSLKPISLGLYVFFKLFCDCEIFCRCVTAPL